jgi:hypothetical protein
MEEPSENLRLPSEEDVEDSDSSQDRFRFLNTSMESETPVGSGSRTDIKQTA